MQEMQNPHSDSDELVDMDQDEDDDFADQQILGENHVMLHDDHLSDHPSEEEEEDFNYNHQDTGDD